MPKTRNSQTYRLNLPPVPEGIADPVVREHIAAMHQALMDLQNQLNRAAVPGYTPPVKGQG